MRGVGIAAAVGLVAADAVLWGALLLERPGAPARPADATAAETPAPTPATDTTSPSAPPGVLLVLGDASAVPSPPSARPGWVAKSAEALGWPDYYSLAGGPVGYASGSGDLDCGVDFCPSVPGQLDERPAAEVTVVLVSAGRYDAGRAGPGTRRVISRFYDELAAGYPDAEIVATGPLPVEEPGIRRIARQIRVAVTAVGGEYVDLGEPLAPELLSGDGDTLTDEGQAEVAERVVDALG